MTADPAARRDIPDATVARLPEYLRALTDLAERGIASVSSEQLATELQILVFHEQRAPFASKASTQLLEVAP